MNASAQHRFVLAAFAVATLTSTAACREVAEKSDDGELGTQQSAVMSSADGTGGGSTSTTVSGSTACADTTAENLEFQKRAKRVARYITGGTSINPVTTWPCTGTSTASACLKTIHDEIDASGTGGGCWPEAPSTSTTVCGLKASELTIKCITPASSSLSSLSQTLKNCSAELEKCWGTGASAFVVTGGLVETVGSMTTTYMYLDPEPVKLTASLSATSGATAAAEGVNTGTATTAYFLSSTILKSALVPPFGAPCSTTSKASGSQLNSTVQLYGSYYKKCI